MRTENVQSLDYTWIFDTFHLSFLQKLKKWGESMSLDWPTASIIVSMVVSVTALVLRYVPTKKCDRASAVAEAYMSLSTDVAVIKSRQDDMRNKLAGLESEIKSLFNEIMRELHINKNQKN